MMHLDLFGVSCRSTVFARLSQEPLFKLRSPTPFGSPLVVEGYLNVPFQGNASPSRYQGFFPFAFLGDLQNFVGLAVHDEIEVDPLLWSPET
jgi:hypothetical protein